MISFNVPPHTGDEEKYISEAISLHKLCGDGPFTERCSSILVKYGDTARTLLTTSGTHALEMAAILSGIGPGDEVIMPSYTFVSTANAFVLRGAKVVFTDIRPDTMNIDETLIEDAITERTRVIVPVHYGGVSCDMDAISDIAERHGLMVVEDAAQGIMARYRGKMLGTLGDFGCYSFHETKNISMGEGGALFIKDGKYSEKAEIIREKGTNRCKFYRGEIDKYTWVDTGSSYLPSELNAAYLYAQLLEAEKITQERLGNWELYRRLLTPLAEAGHIGLPHIPEGCEHNAHMFYIKCRDKDERAGCISFLKENGVCAVFHYIPLHSSPAGRNLGRFHGADVHTTRESERILRLPMYYGLRGEDVEYVCGLLGRFYTERG